MPVIIVKPGVIIKKINSQMILALEAVEYAWAGLYTDLNPVLTSCNDSRHMVGSRHYQDFAWDFGTINRGVKKEAAGLLVMSIKHRLRENFDVVEEPDHIHIEWDPKDG